MPKTTQKPQYLSYHTYREKLKGCFIGKAVGGTLGMPYEGQFGIRSVDYYDPVPTGMTENDDLDLQVVALSVIREKGLPVNRRDLADGWLNHIRAEFDEYGACLKNLRHHIFPPLSGSFDNKFTAGMGAAIRSELWAGLAPGDPKLAARLAKEDACVDHTEDGLDAEVFLAAIESEAYLASDPQQLIQTGLSLLPRRSRLAGALRYTAGLCAGQAEEPFAIRERVLSRYYVQNWTDVTINLCFILIAWLCGGDDISRCLCLAAELGHDTDCTCATLGAILGIIQPDGFEKRWTDPIGESLVLSANIANMHEPVSIQTFCLQIAELCTDVLQYYRSHVVLDGAPFFTQRTAGAFMMNEADLPPVDPEETRQSLIAVRPFIVSLQYPQQIVMRPGETGVYTLTVVDPTHELARCGLQVSSCDSLIIHPRCIPLTFDQKHTASAQIAITLEKNRPRRAAQFPLYLQFEVNGLRYDCTAGILTGYEFLRIPSADTQTPPENCPALTAFENAELDFSATHYRTVPQGAYLYTVEFRNPVPVADALFTVTGTRAMAAWIDDRLALSHDSNEYIPAFHRSDNTVPVRLDANWHRLTIWVGAAAEPKEPDENEMRQISNLSLRAQRRLYERKNLMDGIDESGAAEGECFAAFSSKRGLSYLQEMEWRLPKIAPMK